MRSTDTARCTIKAAIRLGAVALAASVLAACSHSTAGTDKWLSFHCPDGQTVMARFDPRDEFVDVRFAGNEYRLPHTISGSGARYSDGTTTFWNKGRSALIQSGERVVVQDCMTQ
jgi:membrane-bound inhibitor of C-type lysozyme